MVSIGYEDGYVWLKFILVFCFLRQVILCMFILLLLMPLRDRWIRAMFEHCSASIVSNIRNKWFKHESKFEEIAIAVTMKFVLVGHA